MSRFLYNHPIFRKRRQDLRRRQTRAEKVVWQAVRNEKVSKLKFYRQYSVGPYILDFYCPRIRLAIELDGPSHNKPDSRIYDKERDQFLRNSKIKVMRFKNGEVISNIQGVIEKICSLSS